MYKRQEKSTFDICRLAANLHKPSIGRPLSENAPDHAHRFPTEEAENEAVRQAVLDIAEVPAIEVYSIDEAFLRFPSDFTEEHARALRAKVLQWTGIPVCIGIAAVWKVKDSAGEGLVLLRVAVGKLGQELRGADPYADRDACPLQHLGPECAGMLLGEV